MLNVWRGGMQSHIQVPQEAPIFQQSPIGITHESLNYTAISFKWSTRVWHWPSRGASTNTHAHTSTGWGPTISVPSKSLQRNMNPKNKRMLMEPMYTPQSPLSTIEITQDMSPKQETHLIGQFDIKPFPSWNTTYFKAYTSTREVMSSKCFTLASNTCSPTKEH